LHTAFECASWLLNAADHPRQAKKGTFTLVVNSDSWYFLQTVGGEKFLKIRKSLYQRPYSLSADKRKLRWVSKKKEPRESFLFTSSIKKIMCEGPPFCLFFCGGRCPRVNCGVY
jgi:hypothetical protein